MISRKGAQLSIFIVIGALVLFLVIFLLTFNSQSIPLVNNQIDDDFLLVKEELEKCFDDIIYSGLEVFGSQGGKLEYYISSDGMQLPIELYLDKEEKMIPKVSDLESDFEQVVARTIHYCVDESTYESFNLTKLNTPQVEVQFNSDSTSVDIDFGILLESESLGKSTKISKFNYEYYVRMPHYLEIASELTDMVIEDPTSIDLIHLSGYDVSILMEPLNATHFTYSIVDLVEPLTDKTFILNFAVIIETDEIIFEENNAPQFLGLQKEHNATLGKKFVYDVNAADIDGDQMYYGVESLHDFSISKYGGLLEFTPTKPGEFKVRVLVDDGRGASIDDILTVEVQ